MLFAHDTTSALILAADLVNAEDLTDAGALEVFLDKHQVTPRPAASAADLAAVLALRPRLRAVWRAVCQGADQTGALAELVNKLLRDSGARPWLVDHGGGFGWHLHVTGHEAALEHRIAAQTGFAFADLVRMREESRLRQCDAPDCDAVFVDLSKNRSRRYCDTGNCGNRQHVAAYRERRAARRHLARQTLRAQTLRAQTLRAPRRCAPQTSGVLAAITAKTPDKSATLTPGPCRDGGTGPGSPRPPG
jgi:predicted RNA-binding Zn ribbon-like protein